VAFFIDAPRAFVDWIGVTDTLQHAATGGVRTITLSQLDGSLLAIAHAKSTTTGLSVYELPASAQLHKQNADCVTGALIASIWQNHNAFGSGQELQSLVLDCESGQIIVCKIGQYLLTMVASLAIQPGMLRGKMMTVAHSLEDLYKLQEM
jgi:predicted regulator of Ras-like GTPase activity (Roadblock/LC7/MglB family)